MINFYRIVSSNTNKVYIGSTVNTLEHRLKKHEISFKRYLEEKYEYISSYEILESKDYSIELIENKFCETKLDRWEIERYHILNTVNCINICHPGRTKAQFYQENKQEINEKANQKFNCQCTGKYTRRGKSQHFKSQKHINYLLQHP